MFGDVGHGTILLLYALYLIYNERKLGLKKLNEMVQITYDGRYVLLIMAIFSIYCGFIYNECFSLGFDIFGTAWSFKNGIGIQSCSNNDSNNCYSYPFGIDPAWHETITELAFYNSFKMKLSIILGIIQMTFGVILSFYNAKYYKNKINIFFEFIPQIIFLGGLFGYLVIIIIIKWCTDWNNASIPPPSLITVFTQLFLSIGSVAPDHALYNGQAGIQGFLVVMAVISVPWMLLPKPLLLRRNNQYHKILDEENEHEAHAEAGHVVGHGEFDFTEVLMHQIIHTIEFVLGAISNTASYLRLWALSLAHSQLSKVFWTLLLVNGMQFGGVGAVIGLAAWLFATMGVIMVMESLSAFLHALRLHWVEYQNKFYEGSGYKFNPFSFQRILKRFDENVVN